MKWNRIPVAALSLIASLTIAFAAEAEVATKYDAQLYGYLKGDVAYDTDKTNPGPFARWVEDTDSGDELRFVANETRFGLKLTAPEQHGLQTGAKLEFDFYGGGPANSPAPRLRHGYAEVRSPAWGLTVLAGQTRDIIAPLNPTTLNYSPLWWAGNIGTRRPQLRLTKSFDFGEQTGLDITMAATHTVDSEAAGTPTGQGRIGLRFPGLSGKGQGGIGVFGHVAQQDLEVLSSEQTGWSAGIDLALPLASILVLKSELWMGAELSGYAGAIGQDARTTVDESALPSRGGWVALAVGPLGFVTFNVMGGIDSPKDDDLPRPVAAQPPDPAIPGDTGTERQSGARSRNVVGLANVLFDVTDALRTGVEASYWRTSYRGDAGKSDSSRDALRFQSSMIYRF